MAGRRRHAPDRGARDEPEHEQQHEADDGHVGGDDHGPEADHDEREAREHDERDLLHEQLGALGVVADEVLQPALAVDGPLVPGGGERRRQHPGAGPHEGAEEHAEPEQHARAERHGPEGPEVDRGGGGLAADREREAGQDEQGEGLERSGDHREDAQHVEQLAVLGPRGGHGHTEDALDPDGTRTREQEHVVGNRFGREV